MASQTALIENRPNRLSKESQIRLGEFHRRFRGLFRFPQEARLQPPLLTRRFPRSDGLMAARHRHGGDENKQPDSGGGVELHGKRPEGGVWSAECGVGSGEWGVGSAEGGMRNAEGGGRSVEGGRRKSEG